MRRKDREMDKEFAYMVTDKCEYAVIGMTDTNNMPYCVPITIVRDDGNIYFHSAKEGSKTDCLNVNNNVCIVCVGDTFRTPDKFTTEYESAVIHGQAYEVTDNTEKIHALRLLCERHTPTNMDNFNAAIERSLDITAVWRIEISDITGKRKKYDVNGKEMKFGRMQ